MTTLELRKYAWERLKGQPFADRTVEGAWNWSFSLRLNPSEADRFNPNPQQTWTQLLDKVVAELETNGVAYVWSVPGKQGKVKEMHCVGGKWLIPQVSFHQGSLRLPHLYSEPLHTGETWGCYAGWPISEKQLLTIKHPQQTETHQEATTPPALTEQQFRTKMNQLADEGVVWDQLKLHSLNNHAVQHCWNQTYSASAKYNPNTQFTWVNLIYQVQMALLFNPVAYVWKRTNPITQREEFWFLPNYYLSSPSGEEFTITIPSEPSSAVGNPLRDLLVDVKTIHIKDLILVTNPHFDQKEEKTNGNASLSNLQNQEQPSSNPSEEEINSRTGTIFISTEDEQPLQDHVQMCVKILEQRNKLKELLLEGSLSMMLFGGALTAALASFAYDSWSGKASCAISAFVFTGLCVAMIHNVCDTYNEWISTLDE